MRSMFPSVTVSTGYVLIILFILSYIFINYIIFVVKSNIYQVD